MVLRLLWALLWAFAYFNSTKATEPAVEEFASRSVSCKISSGHFFPFESLPKDIKNYIFSYSNVSDLGRISCVNKSLNTLASANALWYTHASVYAHPETLQENFENDHYVFNFLQNRYLKPFMWIEPEEGYQLCYPQSVSDDGCTVGFQRIDIKNGDQDTAFKWQRDGETAFFQPSYAGGKTSGRFQKIDAASANSKNGIRCIAELISANSKRIIIHNYKAANYSIPSCAGYCDQDNEFVTVAGNALINGMSSDGKMMAGRIYKKDFYNYQGFYFSSDRELTLPNLDKKYKEAKWDITVSGDGQTFFGNAWYPDHINHKAGSALFYTHGSDPFVIENIDNGKHSSIKAVNYKGTISVGETEEDPGKINACFWQQGEPRVTSLVGTSSSYNKSSARGVSADGQFIVGYCETDHPGTSEAFIWTESYGMQSLQNILRDGKLIDKDARIKVASAISPNGTYIVGWGEYKDKLCGWQLVLPHIYPLQHRS